MNASMRKIVYYENILEFKETTKCKLNLNEVNSWQLCRTCLADTKEDDMDLEKMCVMDFVEGRLLTIKEMLVKVTPLEFQQIDELPALRMCKECLEKITTLYFFSMQVNKAEEVLRRLSEKLREKSTEDSSAIYLENEKTLDSNYRLNEEKCTNIPSGTNQREHETTVDSNEGIYNEKCGVVEACDSSKDVDTDEVHPSEEDTLRESTCPNENPSVANESFMSDTEEFSESVDGIHQKDQEKIGSSPSSHQNQTVLNAPNKSIMASIDELSDAIIEIHPKEEEKIAGTTCSNENQIAVSETIMVDCEEHLEIVDDNLENSSDTEDCIDQSDSDFEIADDMVDEVYLLEEQDEMSEDKISSNERMIVNEELVEEYVFIRSTREQKARQPKVKKSSLENFKTYKHRQSRVTKPLLENFKCGVCKKMFDRQRELVSHVKQEHPNSKAYQCRDCGALFSHTQSLSRHMNTHKPMLNKNVCEYCSKAFLRPDDLRRHIRIHTGERPYSCPLCEKAFKQHGEMKQHMRIHLQQKQYECDQCDRTFASRNSLYLHKKSHSVASGDHLKCSDCGATFSNKQDVLTHKHQVHVKKHNITF